MRAVIPSECPAPPDLSDADLEDIYAWPETGPHLRTNMVMTLTGAVADAAGSSRGISSPADRRLLGLLRRRCDALLVGAGTLRAENYAPLRAAYAESRIASGQRSAPVLAVVSNRLDLPLESPLFMESAERPVILTCAAAPTTARHAAAEVADIVDCGATEVDLSVIPMLLAERGLPRIHCEGGPTLLAGLLTLDLVDELLLTLSPMATVTDTSNGTRLHVSPSFALTSVLEDSGSLFCRYRRTRGEEDAGHGQ